MAKLERKMEITLPLPEQKFRRFADLWSGLKCGHTMARRSAKSNALGSAVSELINLPWDGAMMSPRLGALDAPETSAHVP
jgi:hypothetical protein